MRSLLAHACLLTALVFTSADAFGQTWEEYNDPTYWQRQKTVTQSREDHSAGKGMTLAERANYCEQLSERVSQEVTRAGSFIIKFSTIASPSRGYITQGAMMTDQREINTYATVAHRDMRYEKYDGADIGKCKEISDFAIQRIQNVLRKYPDFDQYDPNSSTAYR